MRLDDPALDDMASEAREALLLTALRRQIAFMRTKVPFWRDRLATFAVDEGGIETMADLAVTAKHVVHTLIPYMALYGSVSGVFGARRVNNVLSHHI